MCPSVHFPVISDVLSEFFSKLLATDGVGFSLKRPFRRYQVCPRFIRGKGRYKGNRRQRYHDPALSLSPHQLLNGMLRTPFDTAYVKVLSSHTTHLRRH